MAWNPNKRKLNDVKFDTIVQTTFRYPRVDSNGTPCTYAYNLPDGITGFPCLKNFFQILSTDLQVGAREGAILNLEGLRKDEISRKSRDSRVTMAAG